MCGYAPTDADPSKFQTTGPGKFNNRATGIVNSPDSSRYVAAYLKPGQKATMESTAENLFADSDKQIKFQEYKVTQGIVSRVCCDSIGTCPYATGAKVEKIDFRQWYQGSITCKRGTKKDLIQ
uniref:Uncharacterized protein n=1 Tax=Romanomermis culicivorax TaxID=13658 RepID=A0A915JVX2_ROMCU